MDMMELKKYSLKDYRKRVLCCSQKSAGEILGITGVTYGQWETGKRIPHPKTMMKMSAAFNCIFIIDSEGFFLVENKNKTNED